MIRLLNCEGDGLTLVELMITIFILTIGIMSALLFFVTAMASTEFARDTTVASTHANYLFEHMTTLATLTAITTEDWTTWAVNNGLNTLPGETFTVSYEDPEADPLQVTAAISWTRRNRNNEVLLITELTK
jgi:prepilin-type N-terminal cleavage/methylation domain-containing protein